jgi:hypothetical protein
MDYGKSGNPKNVKGTPKFDAHSRHGTGAPAWQKPGLNADKAAFLKRMKSAAEAAKSGRSKA